MKNYLRENIDREFSKEIKKLERINANYKCRICGISGKDIWLQCAHIYAYTTNSRWERNGTIKKKWNSDKYVSSYDNCLLLCVKHHKKIDSTTGLILCNVEYLESLKYNSGVKCTALKHNGKRCNKKGKYRCKKHVNGGYEENLIIFDDSKNHCCIIL